MPDGFSSFATQAILRSRLHHLTVPVALYSEASETFQSYSVYGQTVMMRAVGVITQSDGHFVTLFGLSVASDVPSFGIVTILLQALFTHNVEREFLHVVSLVLLLFYNFEL